MDCLIFLSCRTTHRHASLLISSVDCFVLTLNGKPLTALPSFLMVKAVFSSFFQHCYLKFIPRELLSVNIVEIILI